MRATHIAVACALTLTAGPLAAQAAAPARRIGVGVSLPDVGLFLPINISSRLRVEPFVNAQSSRADYTSSSDTTWYSFTQVGLGVFVLAHPQERLTVYFGPRGGLLRGSRKQNGTTGQGESEDSGWFIAGAGAAEYAPVPRFSLGAEAKIQYDHATSSTSGAVPVGPAVFARSWFTSGVFFVRFYP
jgi:hypothetical protein